MKTLLKCAGVELKHAAVLFSCLFNFQKPTTPSKITETRINFVLAFNQRKGVVEKI